MFGRVELYILAIGCISFCPIQKIVRSTVIAMFAAYMKRRKQITVLFSFQ